MNIVKRITDFNKGRNPQFLALKYKALTETPFRFFRGTCHLFYEDLASKQPFKDPTKAWICGDLHIENFGTFKGANGMVYFDLNDFDEAIMAPISWEILRILTSIHLAVAELTVAVTYGDQLADYFLKTYERVILTGKPMVFEREITTGLVKTLINKVAKRKLKTLIAERTTILPNSATIKLIDNKTADITKRGLQQKVMQAVSNWCKQHKLGDWEICDAKYIIAGTGSLGVDRFIVLIHNTSLRKFYLLDMKEAKPSSLYPYVKLVQPTWENEVERVISVQHTMQYATPAMLAPIACNNKFFVIRKLQPQEDRMSLTACNGKIKKLEEVIGTFAEIAASAHLRGCGRKGASTVDEMITFFKTSADWQQKLLDYSKKYALKVKKDWIEYCKNPPV